jgi:hypothetical protein
MKYYRKSRRDEISYIKWEEGKLIGLVTSGVGTDF